MLFVTEPWWLPVLGRKITNCQEKSSFKSFKPPEAATGGLRPAILLKKRLWHKCFPVNFVKFLRTPFFIEHLRCLLLNHGMTS